MVVYTILVVIYVVVDWFAMLDAKEYNENMKSSGTYNALIHEEIAFMRKIRVLVLITTATTMLLTWGNQVYLEMYLLSLPVS